MSNLRRKCKNDPDNFCYICGQYTPPVHRRKFTPKVMIACDDGGMIMIIRRIMMVAYAVNVKESY